MEGCVVQQSLMGRCWADAAQCWPEVGPMLSLFESANDL